MARLTHRLQQLAHWDRQLTVTINRCNRWSWLSQGFALISRLGNGVFWYALMVGLLLADQLQAVLPVLHMVLAGLSTTLLYKWLKAKTSRPRPFMRSRMIQISVAPLDEYSFPSGHTMHAVVFTLVALSYYPALASLLLPFTALVALSRLVLGLHYPSDVLAGALCGALIAWLSFLLF